jgi:flagellar motor protein MotB
MPSEAMPTHKKLLGEGYSIGGILALLFAGIITSITTAQLLLPPGMTMASFKTWLIPVETPEHSAKLPVPAPSTKSKHDESEEIADDTKRGKDFLIDDRIHAKLTTESEEPPFMRMNQGEQRTTPLPTVKADRTSTATATFAAIEATATTYSGDFESKAERVDTLDCAPLFFVRFKRDGIQPLESDLAEKAHKLHDWLKLHPQTELLVEGHADASGSDEYNLFISHRRAKAVYKLLVNLGIPEQQMAIRALGEYSPLSGVPAKSAKNRRVTLRIEGVRACSNLLTDGHER